MPPRETGKNWGFWEGGSQGSGQRLPPNFTSSRDPASPEELAPTIIWKRGTLRNVSGVLCSLGFAQSPCLRGRRVAGSRSPGNVGGDPRRRDPRAPGRPLGATSCHSGLEASHATRDWNPFSPTEGYFPDGERVLLPPLITAVNRGLKTAIPHSMRRKVLIPRWALWPNKPTTIETATGNTKSNQR